MRARHRARVCGLGEAEWGERAAGVPGHRAGGPPQQGGRGVSRAAQPCRCRGQPLPNRRLKPSVTRLTYSGSRVRQ
jgi:hypothetical protein